MPFCGSWAGPGRTGRGGAGFPYVRDAVEAPLGEARWDRGEVLPHVPLPTALCESLVTPDATRSVPPPAVVHPALGDAEPLREVIAASPLDLGPELDLILGWDRLPNHGGAPSRRDRSRLPNHGLHFMYPGLQLALRLALAGLRILRGAARPSLGPPLTHRPLLPQRTRPCSSTTVGKETACRAPATCSSRPSGRKPFFRRSSRPFLRLSRRPPEVLDRLQNVRDLFLRHPAPAQASVLIGHGGYCGRSRRAPAERPRLVPLDPPARARP